MGERQACGAQIPEEAHFCPGCGKEVSPPLSSPEASQVSKLPPHEEVVLAPPSPPVQLKPKKPASRLGRIIVTLVLAFLFIYAFFNYFNPFGLSNRPLVPTPKPDITTTTPPARTTISPLTSTLTRPPQPSTTEIPAEVHLNVPHNLQGIQSACAYFAVYNILSYYKENITLQDFLGISGYYSSFAEMHYGLGWEKYHGKFYMIGGRVLPELGYISYFSQQIQLADYPAKEKPIKESLSSGIPLFFIPNHENFWYLNAVRQGTKDSIITNFENLNVFEQPSVGHAVVITGYKQVGKDLFLEISDSGYENSKNPYYYINFKNYLDFLDYVKENQEKRSSFEDPLVDNTLIYKIIKDKNKFKISGEVTYPLTITFDAESGEKVPLLLSIEVWPDLKGQGIYHESGYTEILAQMLRF